MFIDSFGSNSTRHKAVTGVYLSFSNIVRRYKHHQQNIHTFMLIPPDAPLEAALKPLREDLILLEKGVEMKYTEDGKISKVVVKAAISCLIADHIQACEICRHIGVNATMNCRACWIDKEHRADHTVSVLPHESTN